MFNEFNALTKEAEQLLFTKAMLEMIKDGKIKEISLDNSCYSDEVRRYLSELKKTPASLQAFLPAISSPSMRQQICVSLSNGISEYLTWSSLKDEYAIMLLLCSACRLAADGKYNKDTDTRQLSKAVIKLLDAAPVQLAKDIKYPKSNAVLTQAIGVLRANIDKYVY